MYQSQYVKFHFQQARTNTWQILLTYRQTDHINKHAHTHICTHSKHAIFTHAYFWWAQLDTVLTTHHKYLKYNNDNINNSLTKSFTFLPLTRLNFDNKVIKILFRLKKLVAASSWLVTTNLVISNQNVLKLLQRRSGEGLVGVTY